MSYGEGRYLYLNVEARKVARAVGCEFPEGKRIFDIAPGLRETAFGKQLAIVLAGGRLAHSVERMPVIFPGAKLSARIAPRPDGVHVFFRMALPASGPSPDRRRNASK